MSELILYEGPAAPTPPAGGITIYPKVDGKLYWKNDSGTEIPFYPVGSGTGDLLSDGSIPLVANWDVGAFKIVALQFESDATTGTAPFIVASTTVVTNLNADQLDGNDATAFATAAQGALADSALQASDIGVSVQAHATVLDNTTASYTTAEETKLAGIEDLADVTDSANVATAGAVMDSDFTPAEGMMRKTGAGAYTAIKTNLTATAAPNPATDDNTAGYGINSVWVDTVANQIYFCTDTTTGAAVWRQVGSGTGGGGGGMTVVGVKTSNYTAGEDEVVPVDSSAGSFTITMPASASAQSRVIVMDVGKACAEFPVTLGRNSQTFDGVAEDFIIDQDNGRVDAVSDGAGDFSTHLIGTPNIVYGPGGWVNLGTTTVAGAAATDITVSGLDLSAYSMFKVLVKMKNATGSALQVSLFYNGDTTATNYYSQLLVGTGSTSAAARVNTARILDVPANELADGEIQITSDVDGKARSTTQFTCGFSGIAVRLGGSSWTTAANVTSITINSSVASSFDIGSTVTVYGVVK